MDSPCAIDALTRSVLPLNVKLTEADAANVFVLSATNTLCVFGLFIPVKLNPLVPLEPLLPLEPADPVLPLEPLLPLLPVKPDVPLEPVDPLDPLDPLEPREPDDPLLPLVPLPLVPDDPLLPLEPELPALPFCPDVPDDPFVPDEPLLPADPAVPLLPAVPFLPLDPDEPNVPSLPLVPLLPEIPDVPATGDTVEYFISPDAAFITTYRVNELSFTIPVAYSFVPFISPVINILPAVWTSNGTNEISCEPLLIFSTLSSKKSSPYANDGVDPPRLICKIEAIYSFISYKYYLFHKDVYKPILNGI